MPTAAAPFYDQDGVHDVYRAWRQVMDGFNGERAMVAEAWVSPLRRLARYVRADEFHQAFNFTFLMTAWRADSLRTAIVDSLAENDAVGAPTTWVLSNHDVVRHASRLGFPGGVTSPWLEAGAAAPDLRLGLRRARAATVLMLGLPGSAYLYQGEELGLPEVIGLPAEVRPDPTFRRTQGALLGRDGCRVPLPWTKGAPSIGFGPTGRSWLPQPDEFEALAVDQQVGVQESTLELYRSVLTLRRDLALGRGRLVPVQLGADVVAFDNFGPTGTVRLVLNLGADAWSMPRDAEILVCSTELLDDRLQTDQSVWMRLPAV